MTHPATTEPHRPYQLYGIYQEAMYYKGKECVFDGPAGTGKSRFCLEKIHICMEKYPHARALILRKTRESLTDAALVTFEEKVLPEDHYLIRTGPSRRFRHSYNYANGSIIAVGGLDKPGKIMSTEWDIIYIQELIECEEVDYQSALARLRNYKMPYQQLLADTNPDVPEHWIKQREAKGKLKLWNTRHEDNPRYFHDGAWTPEGLDYLKTLNDLDGVLRDRLLSGLWVSSEGVVYDEWNPRAHIVEDSTLAAVRRSTRMVVAGVDWGYTNPGVILVGLVDGDGRVTVVHETYMTGKTIDWWVNEARQLHAEWGVQAWACDPSEPSFIEDFQRAGLNAVKAQNEIAPGIQAVKQRLRVYPDGRPRFMYMRGSLRNIDQTLLPRKKPNGFLGEVSGYKWEKAATKRDSDVPPVKKNDHAMDAVRYLVMQVDQPVESNDAEAYDENPLYASANTYLRY